jgi:P4 family phage/plasmid primase-like protien
MGSEATKGQAMLEVGLPKKRREKNPHRHDRVESLLNWFVPPVPLIRACGNDGGIDGLRFAPAAPFVAAHGNDGLQWRSNFGAWGSPSPQYGTYGNEAVETETEKFVNLLAAHGGVVELCVFKPKDGEVKGSPWARGYFDDYKELARTAAYYSGDQDVTGVYVCLNPVGKEAGNEVTKAVNRAGNKDITRRRALLIDFDAVKPEAEKENPSTDAEHQEALDRSIACRNSLKDWPQPIHTDSGNGGGLIYAIDLPKDKDTDALIKRVLEKLKADFGADASVHDAARLTRLPGTMNRKGQQSDDRPYRMARILEAPDKLEVVPREKLEALAPEPEVKKAKDDYVFTDELSAVEFAKQYGLHIADEPKKQQYGMAYNLSPCPFNKDHDSGACLIEFKSGYLAFKCHHNGCTGKGFNDLCELVGHKQPKKSDTDPPKLARHCLKKDFYYVAKPEPVGDVTWRHLGGRYKLAYHQGCYFTWEAGLWSNLSEDHLDAKLVKTTEAEFNRLSLLRQDAIKDGKEVNDKAPPVTAHLIRDVKTCLRAEVIVPDFSGASTWLGHACPWPASETVSALNGLFNLRTLKRAEHTPYFFSLGRLGFDIKPDARTSKEWEDYLKQVVPDEGGRKLLQQWAGYVLSGLTKLQKFLLMIGPPGSGKSLFLKVLEALYGKVSTAWLHWDTFSGPHGLEDLIGKGLAIFPDAMVGGKTKVAVERLKSIIGEDSVSINPKGKKIFSTRLPVRFVLNANEMPVWDDAAGAMVRRALPVEFPNSFTGAEDVELEGKLPSIFLWARQGLLDLEEQNWKFTAAAVGEGMLADLKRQGNRVAGFVQDCCRVGAGEKVLMKSLYDAYVGWCKGEGLDPDKPAWFGRRLQSAVHGLEKSKGEGDSPWCYTGISLAPK